MQETFSHCTLINNFTSTFFSAVPLEKSNYQLFPRAEYSEVYSQKVILHAGDALFLPEGW